MNHRIWSILLSLTLLAGILSPATVRAADEVPQEQQEIIESAGMTEPAPEETPQEEPQAEEEPAPEVQEDTPEEAPAVPDEPRKDPSEEEASEGEEPANSEEPEEEEAPEEEPKEPEVLHNDLLYSGASWFDEATPRALRQGETLRIGIDISEWQGKIDWKAVADSGIEFAIIKTCGRYYGSGGLYEDDTFRRNLKEAHENGILVGAYIFSQATTVQEAREEARYLVETVKGYQIDLPLVLDYEYADSGGRLYYAGLSVDDATDICNAFCDEVEKAGYEAMVYANWNMLTNHLQAEQLGRVWLAHYRSSTYYTNDYEYWQFSSSGKVPGISGNVDLDFWFDPGDSTLPFKDVKATDWYYSVVKAAYEGGYVSGTGDRAFSPDEPLSRAALMTMLYRIAGSPDVSGDSIFSDLNEEWYQNPVLWAWSEKLTEGDGTAYFRPDIPISREDLLTVLYRQSGTPPAKRSLSAFQDANEIASYALEPISWAVQCGIVQGNDEHRLMPGASTTRAEACAIITRYLSWVKSHETP